jgi:hypothetical protein
LKINRHAAVGLLGFLASSSVHASEFAHSWVEARYAPCEGIGGHGSFRIAVSGTTSPGTAGDVNIGSLSVHSSSAAFTQGEASVSATASVRVGGAVKRSLTLGRPTAPSIEPSPKPDETRRVYLPPNAALALPKGGELWVSASAIVKTSAGVCALGSSEAKVLAN